MMSISVILKLRKSIFCAVQLCCKYGTVFVFLEKKIKKGEKNEKCDFNIYDAAYNRCGRRCPSEYTPSGESVMVASNTNFVMIEGDKAVIQVSPLTGPGINGVGGITVDGYISDVQFNTDRRGNLILTMNVKGAAASCRLMFTLGKGGGMARVRIDPNYSADDITLFGDLVPAELSTVHQGRTL